MLLLKRELLEELGVHFGGEDAVELGEGVEVSGDVGVHVVLEEVSHDLDGSLAVLTREGEVVELEAGAHVDPAFIVAEGVHHVEVALGVRDDGFESGHAQFEDGVLEIAAAVEVTHLDEDGAVGISKEFVGMIRHTVLEVFDDHVFGCEVDG